MQTDASDLGLGVVLYQNDDNGHQRVIAYASRSLSNTEHNYPAHKLEFLALKWVITDRFHEYLYGGQFDVYTDNNPLTYILTSAKLDATGQRWVASLANYDFCIFYKSGKTNIEADALGCIPRPEHIILDAPTVKALIKGVSYMDLSEYNYHPMDIVCKSTQVVVHKKSRDDWKTEQDDPIIGPVIEAIKSKSSDTTIMTGGSKRLFHSRSGLLFRCGLLYRKVFDGQLQENKFQFVLPKPYWKQSLEACHDKMGHLGIERTSSLLKDRFYWPSMIKDVEHHIKSCPCCLWFKTQPEKAELNPIIATRPLELVHIDYLTIEAPTGSKSDKDANVLIITDHFTCYAEAHVTSSQKAPIVTKTLWENFFVHYGFPEKILSNQGRYFESLLISELCELTQIKKLRTTPYRPEGNGSCERFNRILITMLGTLPEDFKSKWTQHISTLTYAYNCTRSDATGFNPYYLLYGRHPLLPIYIEFEVFTPELSEAVTYKYVQELKKRLENAFQKANDFCAKKALWSKQRFDKTAKGSKLLPGDLVLVKKKGFTSKHKIADKWKTEPYEIVSQRSDGLPVYTVIHNDRERTLHHNMLFPLGLRHDSTSILSNTGKSENPRNPVVDQVDNFPIVDGEVDQPIHKGPQTQSHAKKLMKANLLMDQLFEVDTEEICDGNDDIVDFDEHLEYTSESIRDLILQFWYQQVFTVYMVCCDLAEAGAHSINC